MGHCGGAYEFCNYLCPRRLVVLCIAQDCKNDMAEETAAAPPTVDESVNASTQVKAGSPNDFLKSMFSFCVVA